MSSDEDLARAGLAIYRADMVKRLSSSQFLVKAEGHMGSFLVERSTGGWKCDCDLSCRDCAHRHAARLSLVTSRIPFNDDIEDLEPKCHYCGSTDISRSGFRYNAYGISRRFRCNECLRKFSIKYSSDYAKRTPSETAWLLTEISMTLTKLQDMLESIMNLQSHSLEES